MLFKIVGFLVLSVVVILLNGLTLSILWEWFLSEITGISISIPTALGITLIVRMLTIDLNATREETAWQEGSIKAISLPLIALLLGYIYQFFI